MGKTPEDTMNRFVAAVNAGDLNGALSLYHPDAKLLSDPRRQVTGLPAIRTAMTGFLASKPTLTIESRNVVNSGDVALCCTQWSLRITGPGGWVVQSRGNGAVVLRKGDRGWAIAIENPWSDPG